MAETSHAEVSDYDAPPFAFGWARTGSGPHSQSAHWEIWNWLEFDPSHIRCARCQTLLDSRTLACEECGMTLRPPESPWPPDAAVSEHRIGSQSDLRRSVLESDALSRFWRRPPSRAPARRSAGRTLLGFADASGSRWSSPGQSSDGSGSDSQDAMPEVRQRPRRRTPPLTHSASGGQLTDMPARRRRWTWQALSAPLPHPPSPGEMTDGSDRSDSRGSTPEERQTHLRERALQRQRRWTPPLGLGYNSLAGAQLLAEKSQALRRTLARRKT